MNIIDGIQFNDSNQSVPVLRPGLRAVYAAGPDRVKWRVKSLQLCS